MRACRFHAFVAIAVTLWLFATESNANNDEKDGEPPLRLLRLIYNIDEADLKDSPSIQEDFFLEAGFGRERFMSQSMSMSMSS